MAKSAILLHQGTPTDQEVRLAKTLEFFGVPYRFAELSGFREPDVNAHGRVVFGSAATVAAVLRQSDPTAARRHAAFYVYADNDRSAAELGIRAILDDVRITLRDASAGLVPIRISAQPCEVVGPMAGIELQARMRKDDRSLIGVERQTAKFDTIMSADGSPVYLRIHSGSTPIYLCSSSYVIDIDQEVSAGYYDVKEHFCSAVPLIGFIRLMFREVAWQPQELGACLIVDDPLLKERYGCCDFGNLRHLMEKYTFTTNVAFIPWNWRRTSPQASELFGDGYGAFSVSIHGCDHIKAEFGDLSRKILAHRARLAKLRMQKHEGRTGIHHDLVMVFPQGIFSSPGPGILKQAGFVAAVNTQISPVDCEAGRTRIRDAWDVAIMKYGDFPIFTRRYADHGLENFAFDALLGKPCFIAAHHEFFRGGSIALIQLLDSLRARNCAFQWRPLGEVIRRACRRRLNESGGLEVEMYGTELLISNPKAYELSARVRKKESAPATVSQIRGNEHLVQWRAESGYCTFDAKIAPQGECRFHFDYKESDEIQKVRRSFAFRSSAATRRILCELSDACAGKNLFAHLGRTKLPRVSANQRCQTGSTVPSDM